MFGLFKKHKKNQHKPKGKHIIARESWWPVKLLDFAIILPNRTRYLGAAASLAEGDLLTYTKNKIDYEDYYVEYKQCGFYNLPYSIWFKNEEDLFLIKLIGFKNIKIISKEELLRYRKNDFLGW